MDALSPNSAGFVCESAFDANQTDGLARHRAQSPYFCLESKPGIELVQSSSSSMFQASSRIFSGVHRMFGCQPSISPSAYLAKSSTVIGKVESQASVWPGVLGKPETTGVVLPGDVSHIKIGEPTNVQDNAVLHGSRPALGGSRSAKPFGSNIDVGQKCDHPPCQCEGKLGIPLVDRLKQNDSTAPQTYQTQSENHRYPTQTSTKPRKAFNKSNTKEIHKLIQECPAPSPGIWGKGGRYW